MYGFFSLVIIVLMHMAHQSSALHKAVALQILSLATRKCCLKQLYVQNSSHMGKKTKVFINY